MLGDGSELPVIFGNPPYANFGRLNKGPWIETLLREYKAGLAERGIADGIMAASYRQRPLDAQGHARNRTIAPLRAPVERTFAILKRWYGYRRVRSRSLLRNALQLQLLACALNLRRALMLRA